MPDWLDQLEARSKAFAVASVRLGRCLEDGRLVPRSVVWQFIDAATAVGANHRAARRSRSARELISKLSVVAEEADESVFWLELIGEVSSTPPDDLPSLCREARELRAIFASSVATLRRSHRSDHGKLVPRSRAPE